MTNASELPHVSSAQIQALANEYKGHVFEYRVAYLLAQRFGLEKDFLDHFGGEIKQRLVHYESWLRQVRPELIQTLNSHAHALVNSQELAQILGPLKFKKVIVMGKSAQAAQFKSFEEADILLIDDQDQLLPLSLKLTTQGSALHTKSAGMKSFFVQYFSAFTEAKACQDRFNQACHQAYTMMTLDLLAMAGVEELGDSAAFSKQWAQTGLSELPGALEGEMKDRLHQCYGEMARALYTELCSLLESDPDLFGLSLLPLFGLGLENMIQLTCFETHSESLEINSLTREEYLLNRQRELILEEHKISQSSLYLRLDGLRLGLRIKPMNRFTQPGFKVNCSYSKIKRN